MFDIPQRSQEPEILDDLSLQGQELGRNLLELGRVNQLLGGHRIARKALRSILPPAGICRGPLYLADVGCGGGDTMAHLVDHPYFRDYPLELTGFDNSKHALQWARKWYPHPRLHFEELDALQAWPSKKFHAVFFNLVLHHFSDAQILTLLRQAAQRSDYIIINDLQRNWFPYHLFRLASRLGGFSPISRHDGLLSIKKSFTHRYWEQLLERAELGSYRIHWYWAFRWVVTIECRSAPGKKGS